MTPSASRKSRAYTPLILAGVSTVALSMSACGTAAAEEECEQLINETVAPVEGVESVDAGCNFSFGNNSAGGAVTLTVSTKAEADEVIARIDEAMARNPEIEPDWHSPSNIILNDGTHLVNDGTEVRVIREMLGIEP